MLWERCNMWYSPVGRCVLSTRVLADHHSLVVFSALRVYVIQGGRWSTATVVFLTGLIPFVTNIVCGFPISDDPPLTLTNELNLLAMCRYTIAAGERIQSLWAHSRFRWRYNTWSDWKKRSAQRCDATRGEAPAPARGQLEAALTASRAPGQKSLLCLSLVCHGQHDPDPRWQRAGK